MTTEPGPPANPFAREGRPRGLGRWAPGLASLRAYKREWILKDLGGGLVLTAILVPVGMGYAEAAGLPRHLRPLRHHRPAPGVRRLRAEPHPRPRAPTRRSRAFIAAAVLPLAAGDPERAVALAGLLSPSSTGVLCMVAGLARFGFITDLLSKPVRYGYLNGIALTVLVGQLPKVFGFSVSGDSLLQKVRGSRAGRPARPDQPYGPRPRRRVPRRHPRVPGGGRPRSPDRSSPSSARRSSRRSSTSRRRPASPSSGPSRRACRPSRSRRCPWATSGPSS